MTKPYNQAIPFIVLAIVGLTIVAEVHYEIEIDIGDYLPILAPIGVGGAAIAVAKQAADAKKSIPPEMMDKIKEELRKELKS